MTLSKEQQEFWELLHLRREVDEQGTTCWYKNGELHRLDGPAVIYADGTESWYKNGLLHREHGPAVIHASGYKWFFKNGFEVPSS